MKCCIDKVILIRMIQFADCRLESHRLEPNVLSQRNRRFARVCSRVATLILLIDENCFYVDTSRNCTLFGIATNDVSTARNFFFVFRCKMSVFFIGIACLEDYYSYSSV